MKNQVRVRFAPSPTGNPHIGNIRTAIFTYLFAKASQGVFVLRIEDTDKKREVKESYQGILDSLKWLGLDWDEGPYIQSQRLAIYRKAVEDLIEKGVAYYCFCSPERLDKVRQEAKEKGQPPRYDGFCRTLSRKEIEQRIAKGEKPVVRLKVPDKGEISFEDLVHGHIFFDLANIDDQVLLKSDGFPTYHLANVVDDHLMKITHVTRGDDWISSVPKHLLLYQGFGWTPPLFAHFPLILGPDKAKLSKRHGAVGMLDLKKAGYLPEAILNYLVLLGWAPKNDQEIFSLPELIKAFSLKGVNKANPIFSYQKLDWFNGEYLRNMSDKDLGQLIKPFAPKGLSAALIEKSVAITKERMAKLSDFAGLIDFLVVEPKIDIALLLKKGEKDKDKLKSQLESAVAIFESIDSWKAQNLEKTARDLAQKQDFHLGRFFMALRIAVTGKSITPPLFESMELLGKAKTLARLKKTRLAFSPH